MDCAAGDGSARSAAEGAMRFRGMARWVAAGFLLLILNSAYLWAFASPTVFYMGNVLLHVALGAARRACQEIADPILAADER